MAREVRIAILGDSRDFQREVDKTVRATTGMGRRMKLALAGVGAAAIAFGKQSVDAFVEAEEAQSQLSGAFAKFPKLAGGNIAAIRKLNQQLALKTKFDDDATASGQAVLAQFGLTQKQLTTLTPLLQDYAARTGKDLPTAARDLGKAVQGQGRALKGVGVNFKDSGTAAGNFDQIVKGLGKTVGGFAQQQGTTTAGKLAIMRNQFGELQEEVGARLIPVLTKLASIGLAVIGFLSSLPGPVKAALVVVAGLAAAAFTVVKAVQAWTAVQAALNVVLAANPIVLVAAAVVGLGIALVVAYKKSETFRNIVNGAFNAVRTVVVGVYTWIKTNWPLLLGILTGPIGLAVVAIVKNWDRIQSGARAARDTVVNAIGAAVNFVRDKFQQGRAAIGAVWDWIVAKIRWARDIIVSTVDRMLGPIDELLGKLGSIGGKIAGGIGGAIGSIPGLAVGGPVTAKNPYLVGERGPELFVPATAGAIIPNHRLAMMGGGGSTVNIYMPPGSDGEDVVNAIQRWERRNGTGWRN